MDDDSDIVVLWCVCTWTGKGIEKITKVMMTCLIVLIIVLAIHSLVLPGASEGVKFYLVPNLDTIKARGIGPVIFDAMTHAFLHLV